MKYKDWVSCMIGGGSSCSAADECPRYQNVVIFNIFILRTIVLVEGGYVVKQNLYNNLIL